MTKPPVRFLGVGVILVLGLALTACGTTAGPASSCTKTWKVGLVTDVGKLSDKSFNYDSYQGVVKAQQDSSLCVQGKAIESSSEDDYPKNIGLFVDQKYDIIVTVGFKLGDATIKAAKANPSIKFMMVDNADFTDNPAPSNLLGLTFTQTPKFARQYANLGESISNALNDYCSDVRTGAFPSDAESYHSGQPTKTKKSIYIDC